MSTHAPSAAADREAVLDTLRRLNRCWLERRPRDLAAFLHPDVAMAFPGFSGKAEGREALVAGFADFCENAVAHAYEESEHDVHVAGGTAVASFRFAMVYERDGARYRSTGRDVWVFTRAGVEWLAVWRTMLELAEEPA